MSSPPKVPRRPTTKITVRYVPLSPPQEQASDSPPSSPSYSSSSHDAHDDDYAEPLTPGRRKPVRASAAAAPPAKAKAKAKAKSKAKPPAAVAAAAPARKAQRTLIVLSDSDSDDDDAKASAPRVGRGPAFSMYAVRFMHALGGESTLVYAVRNLYMMLVDAGAMGMFANSLAHDAARTPLFLLQTHLQQSRLLFMPKDRVVQRVAGANYYSSALDSGTARVLNDYYAHVSAGVASTPAYFAPPNKPGSSELYTTGDTERVRALVSYMLCGRADALTKNNTFALREQAKGTRNRHSPLEWSLDYGEQLAHETHNPGYMRSADDVSFFNTHHWQSAFVDSLLLLQPGNADISLLRVLAFLDAMAHAAAAPLGKRSLFAMDVVVRRDDNDAQTVHALDILHTPDVSDHKLALNPALLVYHAHRLCGGERDAPHALFSVADVGEPPARASKLPPAVLRALRTHVRERGRDNDAQTRAQSDALRALFLLHTLTLPRAQLAPVADYTHMAVTRTDLRRARVVTSAPPAYLPDVAHATPAQRALYDQVARVQQHLQPPAAAPDARIAVWVRHLFVDKDMPQVLRIGALVSVNIAWPLVQLYSDEQHRATIDALATRYHETTARTRDEQVSIARAQAFADAVERLLAIDDMSARPWLVPQMHRAIRTFLVDDDDQQRELAYADVWAASRTLEHLTANARIDAHVPAFLDELIAWCALHGTESEPDVDACAAQLRTVTQTLPHTVHNAPALVPLARAVLARTVLITHHALVMRLAYLVPLVRQHVQVAEAAAAAAEEAAEAVRLAAAQAPAPAPAPALALVPAAAPAQTLAPDFGADDDLDGLDSLDSDDNQGAVWEREHTTLADAVNTAMLATITPQAHAASNAPSSPAAPEALIVGFSPGEEWDNWRAYLNVVHAPQSSALLAQQPVTTTTTAADDLDPDFQTEGLVEDMSPLLPNARPPSSPSFVDADATTHIAGDRNNNIDARHALVTFVEQRNYPTTTTTTSKSGVRAATSDLLERLPLADYVRRRLWPLDTSSSPASLPASYLIDERVSQLYSSVLWRALRWSPSSSDASMAAAFFTRCIDTHMLIVRDGDINADDDNDVTRLPLVVRAARPAHTLVLCTHTGRGFVRVGGSLRTASAGRLRSLALQTRTDVRVVHLHALGARVYAFDLSKDASIADTEHTASLNVSLLANADGAPPTLLVEQARDALGDALLPWQALVLPSVGRSAQWASWTCTDNLSLSLSSDDDDSKANLCVVIDPTRARNYPQLAARHAIGTLVYERSASMGGARHVSTMSLARGGDTEPLTLHLYEPATLAQLAEPWRIHSSRAHAPFLLAVHNRVYEIVYELQLALPVPLRVENGALHVPAMIL